MSNFITTTKLSGETELANFQLFSEFLGVLPLSYSNFSKLIRQKNLLRHLEVKNKESIKI